MFTRHLRPLPDPDPDPDPGPRFRSTRRRPRLGQLLVEAGVLTPGDRRTILDRQNRHDARFGDILLANRMVDRRQLYAALARQYGAEVADLDADPPDPALTGALSAEDCLRKGLLPWRRRAGQVVLAASRPDEFERQRPWLTRRLGPVSMAITGEVELHRALAGLGVGALTARAETRLRAEESCRSLMFRMAGVHPVTLGVVLVLAIVVAFHPRAALQALTVAAATVLLATSALKAAAFAATVSARRRVRLTPAGAAPAPPILARLPRVSLLVPLYEEREIAATLIARLDRLDYPRELLDICLIVEADDTVTRATLAALDIPHHMRAIVVPRGRIRTKPRALNYALAFCRGSLIGIYDAEDAPDPDQIRQVVARFHARGPELGCVQAVLDFYNSRSNWLARCFTVEYAAWFRVILPGLARLGLPVPLGGTSLFLRRAVLEELGGWDAHNVTEDADLGVRLARYGYRTEFIDSVTAEEANCRLWPWIRQRSRWLKGYMMTWAVHSRHAPRLVRQLGPWRAAGLQLLFLGTLAQFLLAPLLWLFWLLPFGYAHPFAPVLPQGALIALLAAFLLAEALTWGVGLYAVRGPAHRHLAPWVITIHFYFPLATVAAFKALFELVTRPFFWDKTAHGLYQPPDAPAVAPRPDSRGDAAAGARPSRRRA